MKRRRILRGQLAAVLAAIIMLIPAAVYGDEAVEPAGKGTLAADFFDMAWGIKPENLPGALHLADLDGQISVYAADVDISPVIGKCNVFSRPRFIFSKDSGLVQVNIDFAPQEYNFMEKQLKSKLGEPRPIVYEQMLIQTAFEEKTEWLAGKNTRVSLVSRWTGASVELAQKNFFLRNKTGFNEELGRELLTKIRLYEAKGRKLEASTLCQELLNGCLGYNNFTSDAQAVLASYSSQPDMVEYLGQDDGIGLGVLKNQRSDGNGQQWVRMDFGFCAREKLKRQRPYSTENIDKLDSLSAALCRVKVDRASGRYIVIEQLYLDKSDQIIGGAAAWLSQGTCWPESYIKEYCEKFLERWLTFRVTDGEKI